MSAVPLELKDTFGEWREKINDLVSTVNTQGDQIGELEATPFGVTSATGLTISLLGGRVRDGSDIETLANQDLVIFDNATNVIVIYKKTNAPAALQVYAIADLPKEFVIPVQAIVTSGGVVTTVTDLRTAFNTASGSAGSAAGILQFDKLIETDVVIPANRNGLSISPIVAPGVTVEVTPSSVWVIL